MPNLAWHGNGALTFLDYSWFVKSLVLTKMVPQFANWSIGSFLCPYEIHLPLTPALNDHNHKTPSTSTSLLHIYRGDDDLSASVEPA